MIGRRLLRRLTRLGLATYAMTWCMALTVCAYEDPIADMVVSDSVQMVSVADADVSDGVSLPVEASEDENTTIVPGNNGTGSIDEPDPDSPHDNPSGNSSEVFGTSVVKLDVNNLTYTSTDATHQFELSFTDGQTTADTGKISYFLSADANAASGNLTYNGAQITEAGYLSFETSAKPMTFYVIGKYTYSESMAYYASCKVVLYLPVNAIGLYQEDDDPVVPGNITLNKTKSDDDNDNVISVLVKATDPERTLDSGDADRISWTILENSAEVEETRGIVLTNPEGEKDKAVISYENITSSGEFDILVTYDNTYTDAEDNTIDSIESAAAVCTLNVEVEGTSEEVTAVELDCNNLTITNLTETHQFSLVPVGSETTLTPENVSYILSGEAGATEGSASFRGAEISSTGLLNFSSSTESMTFYVTGIYKKSEDQNLTASCKVVLYVAVEKILLECSLQEDTLFGDDLNVTVSPSATWREAKLLITPVGLRPDRMDQSRITWKLSENGNPVNASRGIYMETENEMAHLFFENLTKSGAFDVEAIYDNTFTDAEGTNISSNAVAVCRLNIPVEDSGNENEAHITDKSLKVQLYNAKNTLPVSIRTADVDKSHLIDYRITDVQFTDLKLNSFLETGVLDDGKTININATKSLVNSPSMIQSLVNSKKGFTTGLIVEYEVDGITQPESLETNNITITFGNAIPTAKTLKAKGTLVFNSFEAGDESKAVTFTGGKVDHIVLDSSAASKGLEAVTDSVKIKTTSALPAKVKKGTVNAMVFLNDETYNLPDNYNVTVPVKYSVKNNAPTVVPDVKSIKLNMLTRDIQQFSVNAKGFNKVPEIGCIVTDSKGRKLSTQPLNVNTFMYSNGKGTVTVFTTSEAGFGKTYKLNLYALNPLNNKTGPVKTVKVSILKEKDSKTAGITVKAKGKGKLDASIPGSALTLVVAGKQTNLDTYILLGNVTSNVTLNDGTDINALVSCKYDFKNGDFKVIEKNEFSLLDAGYGGKKFKVTLNVTTRNGSSLIGAYSGTIAESTVTPKPAKTKVKYNPVSDAAIEIPITNLPGGVYNYTVVADESLGKDKKSGSPLSNPFNCSVTYDRNTKRDVISIYPASGSETYIASMLSGKSFNVKVIPKTPDEHSGKLKAKGAGVKVTIKKNAVSMSASVKGKINSVSDKTSAVATLKFKNVYDADDVLDDITCVSITRKVKKSTLNCTDSFGVYVKGNTVIFYRNSGKNIEAGSYKATLVAYLRAAGGVTVPVKKDVTFKVVRGKTSTMAKPSSVNLINRDYARGVNVFIKPKKSGVNDISNVTIGAKYAKIFTIEEVGTNEYEISLADKYVEKSKVKKLWQAITKTVIKKKVPVQVYYEGSNKPDTVKVTVKIKP